MVRSEVPKTEVSSQVLNSKASQRPEVKVKTRVDPGSFLLFLRELWRSPWTFWVGLRYLKSKKNSRFLSFITILSVMGVALGVTSMLVVLSVMEGFENELKKRMMASELHILIQPTSSSPGFQGGVVPESDLNFSTLGLLEKDRAKIAGLWPTLATEVILKAGTKITGISLKGVPSDRIKQLKTQMTESAQPNLLRGEKSVVQLPGVYLGQELAFELGLIPGDTVTLISPTETEGPMSTVPRLKRYVIYGVYHSGEPEQEMHTVYASLGAVRSFLRKSGVVSQWEVSVRDFDQAPGLARTISKLVPSFRVQDWNQLNAHLFASLRTERLSMSIILAFIIIVASFNIVTTLTLMVLEKKKEIAILKTMGARKGEVAAIFVGEGLLIGSIGTLSGVVLSLVICGALKRYDFIQLPAIYYDRTLPVSFRVEYFVGVPLVALLIVLFACLYPSQRAARLNPLDGIRFS